METVLPLAASALSPYLRQHECVEIVLPLARLLYPRICGSTNRTHWLILHTGRYHGLVGAGARRRAHPEAAPRRSGA